jgi:hypothetical protein
MIHRLITVVTPLLGAALTLASVFALLYMTVQAELMDDPLRRTLAILGTLAAGDVTLTHPGLCRTWARLSMRPSLAPP